MSATRVISINQLKMTDKWQPIRNKRQTVYRTHYMLIKGRNSLGSSFWTYWRFYIALVCGSNTVLSPALQLGTADLSLVPGRSQTENRLSGLLWPGVSSCSWHLARVVPRELGASVLINETKAGPRRSQYRSSVYLYQYCTINIIVLEEAFKEICDLQDPTPGCRTNWKLECFHRIQTMAVTKDRGYT